MGFDERDVTAVRRDATNELGQDDLVEEPAVAVPPAFPQPREQRAAAERTAVPKADRSRRARAWLEECER
jgi:hypothetical protein